MNTLADKQFFKITFSHTFILQLDLHVKLIDKTHSMRTLASANIGVISVIKIASLIEPSLVKCDL